MSQDVRAKIEGKSFLEGYEPGNTGANLELLVYSSQADALAFLEYDTTALSGDFTEYVELFENDEDTRITTAVSGTGSATWGASGGLALATGTTSGGAANALFNPVVSRNNGDMTKFNGLKYFYFTGDWENVSDGAGNMELAIGVTDATTMPDNTTTTRGVWIYVSMVSGVETVYFCTANGSAVTATDITSDGGPDFSSGRRWTVTFTTNGDEMESCSVYRGAGGNNPLATHTTTLPADTGSVASQLWRAWIETGDTTNRTMELDNVSVKYIA